MAEASPASIMYDTIDLRKYDREAFIAAIEQLPALLKREPVGLRFSVSPLPESIRQGVMDAILANTAISDRSHRLFALMCDIYDRIPQVLVACSPDHPLARAAQREEPSAEWGIRSGLLALVYSRNNRYLVWHEALHLLGAKDCYCLPDRGPTCDCNNCIMQYAPTSHSVGDWPFLCRANIDRVRR